MMKNRTLLKLSTNQENIDDLYLVADEISSLSVKKNDDQNSKITIKMKNGDEFMFHSMSNEILKRIIEKFNS